MRKRIDREDGFQEGEFVESWSKKRIVIALVISFGVLGFLGYNFIQWGENVITAPQKITVLGESDENDEVKLPSKDDIEQALQEAREQLQLITSENITSSDAAVQKIIQNLQVAQGEGSKPSDVICNLVCK